MTQGRKTRIKKRASPTIERQEEIHTHLYSAEHFGSILERQGLLQSDNPREQPWCFYLENPCGNLVCVFDTANAANIILKILKQTLYPSIPEMMNAGDAEARDPNEVGSEMVIKRQEVWMKYHSESYNLLHKHFPAVFRDAMMRLVEEVLEVIILELDGQGDFVLSEPIRKYTQGFHHFIEERKRGWLPPEERKRKRLESLKSGRPVRRFRRPKRTGWFKSNAEFLVALRECFDAISGTPTQVKLVRRLKEHPYWQPTKSPRSKISTPYEQRRTLMRWLQGAGLNNLQAATEWHERIKEAEKQQRAKVIIKRKSMRDPVTSMTVSYRAVDPVTQKKEMFTRSVQKAFDPEEKEFEVDAATARQALLTGGFELATKKPVKRKSKRRQKIAGK